MDFSEKLQFYRSSRNAFIPNKGSAECAGFDLKSSSRDPIVIPPNEVRLIPTNLRVKFPHGTYGRIAARSSLSLRGLDTTGGVIDPDFRGDIMIIVYNRGNLAYKVELGDRIAQLICEKFCVPELQEIKCLSDGFMDSERGTSGFGSTGLK